MELKRVAQEQGQHYFAGMFPKASQSAFNPTAVSVAVSGTNNETFSIAPGGSKIIVSIGTEYHTVEREVSYSFVAGANNTILNSAGVVTESQSPILGAWYFYLRVNPTAGAAPPLFQLYPSQTPPTFYYKGNYGGYLSHPGTSKVTALKYVGFTVCTNATTPAFRAFVKYGRSYQCAPVGWGSTGTSYSEIVETGADAIPNLHSIGGSLAGTLVPDGAADRVYVAADADGNGEKYAKEDIVAPVSGVPISANGGVFMKHTTVSGTFNISVVEDVV